MRASALRLIFGFLILFSSLFLIVPHALAQAPTSQPQQTRNEALGTDPDVPTNLHTATQVVMIETMEGILCQLTGVDYAHPNQKCLGADPGTGRIGYVENGGGVIGIMSTMITSTLTPPVSSRQYIGYLKGNFGLSKHAYAQSKDDPSGCATGNRGIGFCGLWPIVDLWLAMRNIVYLIFILVFLIVGLGIMLRLHIDPQTVMSVQNQIPKIIIAIVGITFSFAIAGFLIDVMYVATYLFGAVVSSAGNSTTGFVDVVKANSPFDAFNHAINGGIPTLAGNTSEAFTNLIKSTLDGTTNAFSGIPFFGDILFGVINVLAFLIIAIAIIISLIRLWVSLVIAYLNIILDVVFAPWWILAGVVPSSPISLGSWIRDVVANLSVFPVTVGFIILANVFTTAFSNTGGSIERFVPPLLGGASGAAIAGIVGLGFILMLPQLLTTMKAALKTPKIEFGPLLGPVGAGGRGLAGLPHRTLSTLERTQYARFGDNRKDMILRFFGNPIYGSSILAEQQRRAHAAGENTVKEEAHTASGETAQGGGEK